MELWMKPIQSVALVWWSKLVPIGTMYRHRECKVNLSDADGTMDETDSIGCSGVRLVWVLKIVPIGTMGEYA